MTIVRRSIAWLRLVRKAYVSLLLTLLFVSVTAASRSSAAVVVAGAFLIAAAISLNRADRDTRAVPAAAWGRASTAVIQLVIALLLGFVVRLQVGSGADGIGIAAVLVGVVSLGWMWSALRRVMHTRVEIAHGLVVAALVLFGIATFVPLPFVLMGGLILVAGVAGELATEWLTEAADRELDTGPVVGWLCGLGFTKGVALGVLIVSSSAVWLLLANAGVGATLVGVLLAAGLVFFAASDVDYLAIVVVVAIAASWSLSARSEAPDPASIVDVGEDYFVAFGDSYMSGEGAAVFHEGTNILEVVGDLDPSRECRRSNDAWPVHIAARDVGAANVLFLACSGAVTENIVGTSISDSQPRQLETYRTARALLDADPEFVVVSIGGNDVGFGTIGRTCVGPGDCSTLGHLFLDDGTPFDADGDEKLRRDLADLSTELATTYAAIDAEFPTTPVYVVGYPKAFTTGVDCANVLLTQRERILLNGFAEQLNHVVQSVAEQFNFEFIPLDDVVQPGSAVGNRTLCTPKAVRAINNIVGSPKEGPVLSTLDPRSWIHNSFHPNERGHLAIADAVEGWFDDNPIADTRAPAGPVDVLSPAIASIEDLFQGFPIQVTSNLDADFDDVRDGSWLVDRLREKLRVVFIPIFALMLGWWALWLTIVVHRRHQTD